MSEGHLTKVCISNIGLTVLYLLSIIATIMMISLQNLSLKDLFYDSSTHYLKYIFFLLPVVRVPG